MIADWIALPGGISEGVFWLLTGASFISSFITAAVGIGGGGLLLAIMAVLVPTSALIPVHGLVQFGSNAGRVLVFLRSVAWAAVVASARMAMASALPPNPPPTQGLITRMRAIGISSTRANWCCR